MTVHTVCERFRAFLNSDCKGLSKSSTSRFIKKVWRFAVSFVQHVILMDRSVLVIEMHSMVLNWSGHGGTSKNVIKCSRVLSANGALRRSRRGHVVRVNRPGPDCSITSLLALLHVSGSGCTVVKEDHTAPISL